MSPMQGQVRGEDLRSTLATTLLLSNKCLSERISHGPENPNLHSNRYPHHLLRSSQKHKGRCGVRLEFDRHSEDWRGKPGTSAAGLPFVDMAIVQAAVYDAVQAIEQQYEPYHVQIPGASGSPAAATAKAAHDVLVNLFPAQSGVIDGIYTQYLIDHGLSAVDPGVAVGATAAAGIIALRANDGRFPPGTCSICWRHRTGRMAPDRLVPGSTSGTATFCAHGGWRGWLTLRPSR